MSRARKNKTSTEPTWRPEASLEALRARAALLQDIRDFFKTRNVLEVETPLLCNAAIQDPHLHPIPAEYLPFGAKAQTLYLQTSPEFAMKRLLAENIGPIYQLCKAFRNGEAGRLHNPEFTILEWYRPGLDHFQLMDEVDDLFEYLLQSPKAERLTYQEVFLKYLDIDPFCATITALQDRANRLDILISTETAQTLMRDDWLDLLLTHGIEQHLGFERPMIIFNYPESQAALAKVHFNKAAKANVGERFEVYVNGMELANGYHELTDGNLQEQRFHQDAAKRKVLGHPTIPIDMHLIQALKSGMPASAGIALGVDRLLMLRLKVKEIKDVLAFTIDNA